MLRAVARRVALPHVPLRAPRLPSRAAGGMATAREAHDALREGRLEWGATFAPSMLLMSWDAKSGWSEPAVRPYAPLPLPPSASVFHYGMEVFEGLKAFRAGDSVRLFRPDLNVRRMNLSADRLALPQVDEPHMLALISRFVHHCREWVPHADIGSLYVRPTIIATDPRIGVRRSDKALFFIIASPVGSFFDLNDGRLLDGVRLKADPSYIRAWPGGVGSCKTGGNYAITIGPAENAKKHGFDQILWLSDSKRRLVTEVGMMNVFFVFNTPHGRKLVTPRLDGTILDGVTRRSILELAHEMGLPAEERDIPLDEVFEAVRSGDIVEIFGSGTAAVVCPVWSVECEGQVVQVKRREEEDDLSLAFREKLAAIQRGTKEHRWMFPVGEGELGGEERTSEETLAV